MSLHGGDRSTVESSSTFVYDRQLPVRYSPVPERVLYLDPNKIIPGKRRPEPRVKLFDKQLIFTWQNRYMASGLVNLRNTCFLASVVQCLQHIPALNSYLTRQHKCGGFRDGCIVCMLARLTVRCFSSNEPVEPRELANNLQAIAQHLIRGRQEDAHEFLHSLLNKMQEDLVYDIDPKPDQYMEMTTPVGQIFGGFLRSQIVCLGCNRASNSYEPSLSISLDIKSSSSLEEALLSFVSPEDMGGDEWYSCETCKSKQRAVKSYSIDDPPQILIVHLKRYNQEDRYQSKLSHHVEFEEILDLKPFVNPERREEEGEMTYDLCGVLVHLGNHVGAGHYYSYVANPGSFNKKSWYVMNDEHVNLTNWERVKNSEAYLLFYVRSDCRPKVALAGDWSPSFSQQKLHNNLKTVRGTTETIPSNRNRKSSADDRSHDDDDVHALFNPIKHNDEETCIRSMTSFGSPTTSGEKSYTVSISKEKVETSQKNEECDKKSDQARNFPNDECKTNLKRKNSDVFPTFAKRRKICNLRTVDLDEDLSMPEVKPKVECLAGTHSEKIAGDVDHKREKNVSNNPLKRHYSDILHYRKRSRSLQRSRNGRSCSKRRRSQSRDRKSSRSRGHDTSRTRGERSRSRGRRSGSRGTSRPREPYRSQHRDSYGGFQWSRTYSKREPERRNGQIRRRPSEENPRRERSRERYRRDDSKRYKDRPSRS